MELPDDQYRLLVEAAPMLVWRSGLDAKCDYFNATWLAFTGRTIEQELGDGWAEGVHPEDLPRCLEVYLGSFAARRPFEMEYRLRRHDGVHRWISDRGVPFHVGGEFRGFVGSCIDVHERREADQAKTTFLSMLTHELRTPLQSLILCGQHMEALALSERPVPVAVAQRLGRQTDRLRALLDRAARGIDISRGVAPELRLDDVDLRGLVARVVESRRPRLRGRAELELRDEGSRVPCTVRADAGELEQALDALLDNAFGFSPDGGTVVVELAFEPATVRIAVEDEGIGIPPAELSRIGTPYFRASNVSPRQHAGLGLGLAVARDTVVAHGGTLELGPRAPSKPDFGTEQGEERRGAPKQPGTRAVIALPLPRGGAS
jgi:PAS domain S-box-containing protein